MNYNLQNVKDLSLPKYLNDFLNYLSTIRGKSLNTISGYKFDLIMFFRFLKLYWGKCGSKIDFDDIDISDVDKPFISNITLEDLYAFISFAERNRDNGEYARARKVAALKSFFKYLTGKARIIVENPTLELESPKIKKRNPIYLTLDESKVLLNSIEGKAKERDLCIITFFLNCGMRLSELVGLNFKDINIQNRTMRLLGKGNKERIIYINDACVSALSNYYKVRPVNPKEPNAVFLSKQKTRISKRRVQQIVEESLFAAGLDNKGVTTHKLRHTAATLMYQHGHVDPLVLKEILGHKSIATTEIYTHLSNENMKKAAESSPLANVKKITKSSSDKNDKNNE